MISEEIFECMKEERYFFVDNYERAYHDIFVSDTEQNSIQRPGN